MAVKDIGSLGRTDMANKEWAPHYVSEQLECKELCLGTDEEQTESLWGRIRGRQGENSGGLLQAT